MITRREFIEAALASIPASLLAAFQVDDLSRLWEDGRSGKPFDGIISRGHTYPKALSCEEMYLVYMKGRANVAGND